MAKRPFWASNLRAKQGMKFSARPVIVTRDLAIIERESILAAAAARGVGLEIPNKFDKQGNPVKLPLVKVAEKCGIDGEFFRSKKEAARYVELRRAEASGIVRNLKRNPRFILHTVNPQGLKVAISEYTGDYEYDETLDPKMLAVRLFDQAAGDQHVIEEAKGFPTKDWELRRKWVEAEYGIRIRVT